MLKLQYKIAIPVFLIGCALVLVAIITLNQVSRKTILQEAQNSLRNLSVEIAQQVDYGLREKALIAETLASAPILEQHLLQSNAEFASLTDADRERTIARLNQQWKDAKSINSPFIQSYLTNPAADYLAKQLQLFPDNYGEIFLTNRFGALVASTGKLTTLAHAHKYWWKASYNGGHGKVFFDDRGFDTSAEGYVLGVVVPVEKDGEIVGILKCNISIQSLLVNIIDTPTTHIAQIQAKIARSGGLVVIEKGAEPLSTKIPASLMSEVANLKAGSLAFDDNGVPSWAAFVPISISTGGEKFGFGGKKQSIDQTKGNLGEGWHVILFHSQKTALETFYQTKKFIYASGIAITVVLAMVALYLGRKTARPLVKFSEAAKMIGAGQFNVKLDVSSNDEWGTLANSFNAMATQLAQTVATKDEYWEEIKQRKLAETALSENQLHFEKAQELGQLGSWEHDLVLKKSYWAAETCRIFGVINNTELSSERFRDKAHPEDREAVNQKWAALLNGKPFDLDYRIIVDEQTRWIREKAQCYFDNDGHLIKAYGFVQDITERKLAEEHRLKLEEQLRQKHKMEAIGALAGGIAHDFNNILSIIIGNAEIAKLEIPADHKAVGDMDEIIVAGKRAAELVKQIMTYSQMPSSSPQQIAPAVVIKEALKFMHSVLPDNLEIRTRIDSDCHNVVVDPDKLRQSIVNLCSNASQAIDGDAGLLEVDLHDCVLTEENLANNEGVMPGSYVELIVRDNGHGMDKMTLDRIFDPYFTTKDPDEGTGMGLSIVRSLIDECCGLVRVESEPGRGTVVRLYFPSIATGGNTAPEVPALRLLQGSERILVVDDESTLANLLKTGLEQFGYQVTAKISALDALETLRKAPQNFDLLITDQVMPGMTGLTLAQEAMALRPELPVILCTGYNTAIDEKTIQQNGIAKLLMKPIEFKFLAENVRQVFDETGES